MKLNLLMIFGLVLGLTAGAQNYNRLAVLTNNAVVNGVTNTLASNPEFVGGSEYLGIEVSGILGGTNGYSNTIATVVVLDTSMTRTNWHTGAMRWNYSVVGTNGPALVAWTNIGGVQWVRLSAIEAPGSSPISNYSVVIAPKIIGGR